MRTPATRRLQLAKAVVKPAFKKFPLSSLSWLQKSVARREKEREENLLVRYALSPSANNAAAAGTFSMSRHRLAGSSSLKKEKYAYICRYKTVAILYI